MSTNRRILNLPLITSGNVNGNIVLPLDDPSDSLTKKINLDQIKDFVLSGSVDNNYYTTGATLIGGIVYFNRNDQLSAYTLNLTSLTGDSNTFITAATYNDLTNTITLTDNANTSFNVYIDSVSGLSVNGVLSATTISGGTLYGDGSNLTGISTQDTFVTGGTYNDGTATFTNTSGGTFNVSGFYTGSTDVRITGGTYSAGTITLLNNTGGTVSISGLSTGYTYTQTNNYTATIPITITHNLNTTEILIQIIDTNTNQLILGSVSNYQLNSVDITLSSSLNGIKVVIVGGSLSSATPRGKINLLFGHDSVSPLDSTTYYIGGQFNLAPATSASDGRRLISPVTGFITQVSISETVSSALGSSEPSTFTIENVTQSTSSTITTTATYDSSSSLINYILSSPIYVVNGDKLEIRWTTPAWATNPTAVRQQINVLIDF